MNFVARQPDQTGGAHSFVVGSLRQAILDGRLVPGQRLVEVDLQRSLAVSRGSVREALRQLAAEGLVETIPNQTAVVRRYSKRELVELFEIRAELEALAAGRAAERMDDSGVRERFVAILERADAPRAAVPASGSYFEENRLFHQAIADLCGNDQLATLIQRFQLPLIMFQLGGAITPDAIRDSMSEHRRIAEAILSGNARKAGAEVRTHLKRASSLLEAMPPSIFRA